MSESSNQPTVFVIFGATGDLSRKKIFPSFFELYKNKLLPEKFKIVATARSPFTTNDFINLIQPEVLPKDDKSWSGFAKAIEYISSDIEKKINLDEITKSLNNFEKETNQCPQRVYYMAI